MKLITIEMVVGHDDNGDGESVRRCFSCIGDEGLEKLRALFAAFIDQMWQAEMQIYRAEHGRPMATESDNYRRLADALARLYVDPQARWVIAQPSAAVTLPQVEALLDEFLGDTWRQR